MNGKRITNLAVAAGLAGGLFAGSVGWSAAQDQPGGDEHQHGRGTPATVSQRETTDDAMTSMVRDIMEEMMPGMMDQMMREMMPDMMDQMMAFMMDDMMSHMMGGGMRGEGMWGGMAGNGESGRGGYRAMPGTAGDQRTRMQDVVAEALGLTTRELETELADGKSVREIAEEQGVDLVDVHEAVMDEFGMYDR